MEGTNPYLPPASDVAPVQEEGASEKAGNGRRLGTYLIDHVLLFGIGLLRGMLLLQVLGEELDTISALVWNLVTGTLATILYYVFFEGIWARTPGKVLLGTIVVSERGGKPTFGQIVGRTFARLIPFEPFSFFGERGWHDSLSKTAVVLKNDRGDLLRREVKLLDGWKT